MKVNKWNNTEKKYIKNTFLIPVFSDLIKIGLGQGLLFFDFEAEDFVIFVEDSCTSLLEFNCSPGGKEATLAFSDIAIEDSCVSLLEFTCSLGGEETPLVFSDIAIGLMVDSVLWSLWTLSGGVGKRLTSRTVSPRVKIYHLYLKSKIPIELILSKAKFYVQQINKKNIPKAIDRI